MKKRNLDKQDLEYFKNKRDNNNSIKTQKQYELLKQSIEIESV